MLVGLVLSLIIATVVGVSLFKGGSDGVVHHRESKETSYHIFSDPARAIIRRYDELPAEHKLDINIKAVLRAMDIKHGVSLVNEHFNSRYYQLDWHSCEHKGFKEYRDMAREIEYIQYALAERERQLAISEVQHDLDQIKVVTAALRQERQLIQQVTKELT